MSDIDSLFEAAWNDPDNTRMMRHVAWPFRNGMSEDEWLQLQRLGLMNTLRTHDYSRGRKFINSLRQRTLWVFQTHARGIFRKQRLNHQMISDPPRATHSECDENKVDMEDTLRVLLDELEDDERLVVTNRYIYQMNLSEISRQTGIPRAQVGKLHKSGMIKLRFLVDNKKEFHGYRSCSP